MNMKMSLKKVLPLLLIAGILTAGMSMVASATISGLANEPIVVSPPPMVAPFIW